jgi:hypothetical protein
MKRLGFAVLLIAVAVSAFAGGTTNKTSQPMTVVAQQVTVAQPTANSSMLPCSITSPTETVADQSPGATTASPQETQATTSARNIQDGKEVNGTSAPTSICSESITKTGAIVASNSSVSLNKATTSAPTSTSSGNSEVNNEAGSTAPSTNASPAEIKTDQHFTGQPATN